MKFLFARRRIQLFPRIGGATRSSLKSGPRKKLVSRYSPCNFAYRYTFRSNCEIRRISRCPPATRGSRTSRRSFNDSLSSLRTRRPVFTFMASIRWPRDPPYTRIGLSLASFSPFETRPRECREFLPISRFVPERAYSADSVLSPRLVSRPRRRTGQSAPSDRYLGSAVAATSPGNVDSRQRSANGTRGEGIVRESRKDTDARGRSVFPRDRMSSIVDSFTIVKFHRVLIDRHSRSR